MALYEYTDDGLAPVAQTKFGALGIRERADLQRIIRKQIGIVSPDTLIIAEEFGDWEDSQRRIDLLGIDTDANLVVIEIKRTEDGGHMELQAIRYAAMVSTMTFDQAVNSYAALMDFEDREDARQAVLHFLDWEEPEEGFGNDVRIVLVSAEFSKEITTAVLWLNQRFLDIRCVRIRPYRRGDLIFFDVEQTIPLPEAAGVTIRIRDKAQIEKAIGISKKDYARYDVEVNGVTHSNLVKRNAVFHVVKGLTLNGTNPTEIAGALPWRTNSLFLCLENGLSAADFARTQRVTRTSDGKTFGSSD